MLRSSIIRLAQSAVAALCVLGVTAPAHATEAQAPARGETYTFVIETRNVLYGGTDSDIRGQLTNAKGETTPWTLFDRSGYNDFERGDRDSYTITAPAGFGEPTAFQLAKDGRDDWAVLQVQLDGPKIKMLGVSANPFWITHRPQYTTGTGGQVITHYQYFSPRWPAGDGN
ncbi:PLAT/LH2 domain-containing protein [Streptomyces sp. NBUL23]|uniref:PLAT/LH2 domain-containing protein n=1 Tax=Streptomyces sp. NBUL23 TaxID=3381354 RepID=UPI0038726DE8